MWLAYQKNFKLAYLSKLGSNYECVKIPYNIQIDTYVFPSLLITNNVKY